MQPTTTVAAFRSRQQVQLFASLLNRQGIAAQIINTPHEIAIGCGVSVRFDERYQDVAWRIYESRRSSLNSLVGFYRGELQGGRWKIASLYRR